MGKIIHNRKPQSAFGKPTQDIKQKFKEYCKNCYTFEQLKGYLVQHYFTATFRRHIYDAFYNTRTDRYLLLPFQQETFTKKEILNFFKDSNATSLPPKIEWGKFQLYIYNEFKKNLL